MIVCHCHALTDRDIRDAACACDGSTDGVERICGAGGACGGCKPHVELIAKRACQKTAARPVEAAV